MAKTNKTSNVAELASARGRKVQDTGASMGAASNDARVSASWAAKAAYERTNGTDVWITKDGKAEDSRTIAAPVFGDNTATIEWTVTCKHLRDLLNKGGTARVHKRKTVLDFANVKTPRQWMEIGLSNGVIVKLQTVGRQCIAGSTDHSWHDHVQFGDLSRVDVAALMAYGERGTGAKAAGLDPIAKVEQLIRNIEAIGTKLTSKQLDEMRAEAKRKAAAMAASQPKPAQAPNKPAAAKRKAS